MKLRSMIMVLLWVVVGAIGSCCHGADGRTAGGFRFAEPGYPFAFPHDHGSHPEFKLEWWYVTGHLQQTDGDRSFGFQVTFFRYATGTVEDPRELHLAHMALSEPDRKRFLHEERLNRRGWDAGAMVGDLAVTNGNWSLRRLQAGEAMRLRGSVLGDALLDLRLQPAKSLVRFGEQGYSRKGADETAASLYLTFPRLEVRGHLQLASGEVSVAGQAWMDHEISSSQLTADQIGWNWASIQLEDGREVMIYVMRQRNGSVDPYSRLTWIGRDGALTAVKPDDFTWTPTRHWTSEATGARYPVESKVRVKDPASGQPVELVLIPRMDAQEMVGKVGGINYWEGACKVEGNGNRLSGRAFVELTGYDRPLQAVK